LAIAIERPFAAEAPRLGGRRAKHKTSFALCINYFDSPLTTVILSANLYLAILASLGALAVSEE
jgi:hypothetical protein